MCLLKRGLTVKNNFLHIKTKKLLNENCRTCSMHGEMECPCQQIKNCFIFKSMLDITYRYTYLNIVRFIIQLSFPFCIILVVPVNAQLGL